MIPYKDLKKRIENDKAKKRERQAEYRAKYDRYENVFTINHLAKSYRLCRSGTSYKLSVQRYGARPFSKFYKAKKSLDKGIVPPITSSRKVTIRERGKARTITPIRIADRVIQRALCDNALVPIAERRLIYDNGASRKDMGIDFARRRFNVMLERAKMKWGSDFYVLTFDIKSYFDSIPHKLCYEELDRSFRDKRIVDVCMQVIESYQKRDAKMAGDDEKFAMLERHEGIGICLGSQVSQIMALLAPNSVDHYMKDVLGIEECIRYMDDGAILHQSKAFLKSIQKKLEAKINEIGLRLHPIKTKITHIRHGITFLKIKYKVTDGMKTIKRISKPGIVRMRQKLKKLLGHIRNKRITAMDVYNSIQSWCAHARAAMSWHTRRRMIRLYDALYSMYPGYRRIMV